MTGGVGGTSRKAFVIHNLRNFCDIECYVVYGVKVMRCGVSIYCVVWCGWRCAVGAR